MLPNDMAQVRERDFIGRGMPTTQGRVGSGGGTLKRELV